MNKTKNVDIIGKIPKWAWLCLSLLSAVCVPDPIKAKANQRIILEGDVPSPLNMPSGCPFRTRCRYATEQCAQEVPHLTDRGNGHMVACWNKCPVAKVPADNIGFKFL